MAHWDRPGFSEWFAVARRWVDAAFTTGDSLFTPGKRVWTLANLDDLHHRFIDNADEGDDDFWTKLEKQLKSARGETIQLMAEVLYGYYLPMRGNLKLETKIDSVRYVLDWVQPPVPMADELKHAFNLGVARESQNYIQQRYYQLKLIIEVAQEWWRVGQSERDRLLRDPWAFKEFVSKIPAYNNNAARQMLLYFVHADAFEPIMAESDKQAIARSLANEDERKIADDDRRLFAIRERLNRERKAGFSFYEPDLKQIWKPEKPPVTPSVTPPPKEAGDEEVAVGERRYWKIAPGANAAQWDECLSGGVIRIGWDQLGDLGDADWKDFKKRQAKAMKKYPDWGERGSGQVWTFTNEIKKGDLIIANRGMSQIVGVGEVTGDYFFDANQKVLKHCRSVRWYDTDSREIPKQPWRSTLVELERDEFESLVGGKPILDISEDVVDRPETAVGEKPDHPLIEMLLDRVNVVLHGPPGCGKTYASLHLADLWKAWQGGDTVAQVTFHPSYAYEDFIEGFRPDSTGRFVLQSGILVNVCNDARRSPRRKFLLIIDELNRGDVARIFGELITLIERDKRGARASRRLPYSRNEFFVPPNLYLLGTMNTADRSISLLDIAIRRRFCFVEYGPDAMAINRSDDHHQTIGDLELARLMLALNARLRQIGVERDRAIGHSHFLIDRNGSKPLAELRSRIRHDIVPLIEEYCYANRSQMAGVLGEIMRDGVINDDVLNDDDRLMTVLIKLSDVSE